MPEDMKKREVERINITVAENGYSVRVTEKPTEADKDSDVFFMDDKEFVAESKDKVIAMIEEHLT